MTTQIASAKSKSSLTAPATAPQESLGDIESQIAQLQQKKFLKLREQVGPLKTEVETLMADITEKIKSIRAIEAYFIPSWERITIEEDDKKKILKFIGDGQKTVAELCKELTQGNQTMTRKVRQLVYDNVLAPADDSTRNTPFKKVVTT